MIRDINTLKSWLEFEDCPTQEQFWDLVDSFRHKNDKINFSDLSTSLQNDINSISGFPITLAPGANQFVVPVDMVIEFFRIGDPATLPAFKIGTTVGGNEILDETEITAENRIQGQYIDAAQGTTYYFSGITSQTIIKIYKR